MQWKKEKTGSAWTSGSSEYGKPPRRFCPLRRIEGTGVRILPKQNRHNKGSTPLNAGSGSLPEWLCTHRRDSSVNQGNIVTEMEYNGRVMLNDGELSLPVPLSSWPQFYVSGHCIAFPAPDKLLGREGFYRQRQCEPRLRDPDEMTHRHLSPNHDPTTKHSPCVYVCPQVVFLRHNLL